MTSAKPPKAATACLASAHYGKTIINLQSLWQHYNVADGKLANDDESYVKSAVNCGLEKLNTYREKLVMEPTPSLYTIATALHPRLRLNWFESHLRGSLQLVDHIFIQRSVGAKPCASSFFMWCTSAYSSVFLRFDNSG